MTSHPHAQLSAYVDGELTPAEAAELQRHLSRCTECSREVAIMNNLGGAMRTSPRAVRSRSVWEDVHRRITRPAGWILLLIGLILWSGLALVAWLRAELTLEWIALSGIGVGLSLLAVGIGYEQYREWKDTRYKDVEQ